MVRRFALQDDACTTAIEEEQLNEHLRSSASEIAHAQCCSPSHLEVDCVDVPVEFRQACTPYNISSTASPAAGTAALGLSSPVPGEAPHGLQLHQDDAQLEDSVEAWVSDVSTTSFEFLECGTNELHSLCYDEDYYCDIWDDSGACSWEYGVPMHDETLHSIGLTATRSSSKAPPASLSSSSSPPASRPPPPPPPPPPPLPPPPSSPSLPLSLSPPPSPLLSAVSAAGIGEDARESGATTQKDAAKLSPLARPLGFPCSATVKENKNQAGGSNLRVTQITSFKARRSKPVPVSIEELRAVYHFPREDAASSLQIGCTFLKKICRMHGIKRWPSRKLAALNNHIAELDVLAAQCYSEVDADVYQNLQRAISHAEDTRHKIYQDPNCAITRDLYRELHSFRKQCQTS